MEYRMYTRVGRKILFASISMLLIFLISLFCFPGMHKSFKLAILMAGLEMYAFAAYYCKTPSMKYVNPTRTPVLDVVLYLLGICSIIGFIVLGILNVSLDTVLTTILIEYFVANIIMIDRAHSEKKDFKFLIVYLFVLLILIIKQFVS